MKPKSLLIHNNNSPIKNKVTEKLLFNLETYGSSVMRNDFNIDSYISKTIIPQIKEIDFDVLYIKDSLSSNYMDFYGLLIAYHIRLAEELQDKRFVPIIILSELDGYIIKKLTYLGEIIFTKNIFISTNNIKSFEYFQENITKKFKLNETEYKDKFLNIIDIPPPQDYLSNHDITNEWAIYRWAEFLKIKDSKAIDVNKEKIDSMLYFKYLLALNPIIENSSDSSISYPIGSGKILYIDDEWAKGWSDILENYFDKSKNIEFKTFEYKFKDSNIYTLKVAIEEKIKEYNPDLVILDLRLIANDQTDTNREDISNYSGIQVLNSIKEINKGIQVLMLTATSKSTILDKLYEHDILGYIKKEHPTDKNISTKENFNKLKYLVDIGLEKRYLKNIWTIQKDILELDLTNEIKLEVQSIFEILDSSMENKFNYAMFAIFKCIEIVTSLYIEEIDRKACWLEGREIKNAGYYHKRREYYTSNLEHIESENSQNYQTFGNISIENKIRTIMNEKLGLESNELHSYIKCLVCIRNHTIHQDKEYDNKDFCKKVIEEKIYKKDILIWFKMLQMILEKVSSDKPNH